MHTTDPSKTSSTRPSNCQRYIDVSEYLDTLHAFIHNADMEAKQRLLGTDCLPLLTSCATSPAVQGGEG